MTITWLGYTFFKIQSADSVVVTDPFDLKKIGNETQNKIVTLSIAEDFPKNLTAEKAFLIQGPGEYGFKDFFIEGVASKDIKERVNIVYVIEAEGIRVCHLGLVGQKKLETEQLAKIAEVDILLLPIGGKNSLSSDEVSEIIKQIDPKVIIPMNFSAGSLGEGLEGVDDFLKDFGKTGVAPESKFTIKKKSLPEEETEIVVLKPFGSK